MQNLHAVTRVMAGGFLWILLALHFEQNFLIPYLLCMAAHTGNIITARLRVIQPHQSITRIAFIGIIVPSFLFAILASAGVVSGLLPVITIAWLPLATALSVALFIPVWPPQPTPEQRLRIWFSETVIAILASLPGLIQ